MQSSNNFNNNDKTDESIKNESNLSYNNSSINNSVTERKMSNENLCKVFIGNIPRTATEEQLTEYFKQKAVQFKEMSLMKDPANPSMNRGFGFFTLNTEEETDSLLFTDIEPYQGKTLDIKRAAPKDVDDPLIQTKTERIFVGGLPQIYTVEEITELFNEKYGNVGKVVEVIPKKDKITGKSRGFCFIVFENYHVVDKIMIDNRFPYLNNKRLEVRKASSDFPIMGGPPQDGTGGGMMRRPGPGGKITRGVERNTRMNQNPYRNGSNQAPNTRQPPRRQPPYISNNPMHGSQYQRQTYGYTNRPPPAAYTESTPSMNNPHMPSSYSSHVPSDVSAYGGNSAYVPYGASASQPPPMPSSYTTGGGQYSVNPYGAVNYAVNQGGSYQPTQMPSYPGNSNSNVAPPNNPSSNQKPSRRLLIR